MNVEPLLIIFPPRHHEQKGRGSRSFRAAGEASAPGRASPLSSSPITSGRWGNAAADAANQPQAPGLAPAQAS